MNPPPPEHPGILRGALRRLLAVRLPRPTGPGAADGAACDRAHLGRWGEEIAARHLAARGYRILGRRVRLGRDELDLVARLDTVRRPQLVFVEVKTRRSPDFGGPIAAVDRRKRHALCRAAARYLRRLPSPAPAFRFDVLGVIGTPDAGSPPVVRHIENAFPMEARYVTPWLGGRPRAATRNPRRRGSPP